MEDRETQTDNVYSILGGPVYDAANNTWSVSSGSVAGSLFSPANHLNVSPRIDLQLGQKNTLTLRYQFYPQQRERQSGGRPRCPPSRPRPTSIEHAVQLDDTQIINDRLVNETRFEYRRANSSSSPVSTAPGFGVPGVFSGGGNGGQNSNTHTDHYELQNFTTLSKGAQAIKFGAWLRDDREATRPTATSTAASPSLGRRLRRYMERRRRRRNHCADRGGLPIHANGRLPAHQAQLHNRTGSVSGQRIQRRALCPGRLEGEQDLTLSGGLRWESQNHIADHSDWAPRVAFAYALDGHKKGAVSKTVLRGGFGFFYDRFGIGEPDESGELNGTAKSQMQTAITNPTCFNGTSLSSIGRPA